MDDISKTPPQDIVSEADAPNHEIDKDLRSKDQAAELLKQTGQRVGLTPENNKRVLRIIDLKVLPVILGIYFLQALDKATLAYASNECNDLLFWEVELDDFLLIDLQLIYFKLKKEK